MGEGEELRRRGVVERLEPVLWQTARLEEAVGALTGGREEADPAADESPGDEAEHGVGRPVQPRQVVDDEQQGCAGGDQPQQQQRRGGGQEAVGRWAGADTDGDPQRVAVDGVQHVELVEEGNQ